METMWEKPFQGAQVYAKSSVANQQVYIWAPNGMLNKDFGRHNIRQEISPAI